MGAEFQDKKNIVEAALFVSSKPLSVDEISDIVHIPRAEVEKVIGSMKEDYDDHGIMVHMNEIKGTYELRVKKEYMEHVSRLAPHQDFNRGVLQTLSVIAYKNPVKQSRVITIRGNRAYDHLSELEEKGFVSRQSKGHSKVISITRKFLDYFGLDNPEELRLYFQKMPAIEKFLDQDDMSAGDVRGKESVVPDEGFCGGRSEKVKIGGLDPKLRSEVEKRKKELGIMTIEEEMEILSGEDPEKREEE